MIKHALLYIILLFAAVACRQATDVKTDPLSSLQVDVEYLASDELEGRETGMPGEAKAASYIIQRFKDIGLKPAGADDSYYQPFEFKGTPQLGENDRIVLNGQGIDKKAFYPLNFSGSGEGTSELVFIEYGIHAPDMDYDDYAGQDVKGKVVAYSVSSPDGIHPHSAYLSYHDLRLRAETAEKFGAAAVILINEDESLQVPSDRLTENVEPLSIPVWFVDHADLVKGADKVEFSQTIERPRREGNNVLALLDNGKERTFVIGAHYDHLGYGGSGSLYRGEPAIHNGADDNASGVAAMLLLAESLSKKALQHNVLFIGFSGEEKGLLGSNHFVKNPTYDLDKVNFMMNMDMVGRLDSTTRQVSINGLGTSPSWDIVDSLQVADLDPVTTQGGTGSSDHMCFYLADIPVLHFFSGTHGDYHKPTDDAELINYQGIADIASFMEAVIMEVDDDGELVFEKTKDEGRKAAAFKVTLGVVPDYLYEEQGMRIDGVSPDRPGERGGMQRGDIIIGMGERKVDDIYAYMEALATFASGDSITVTVLRDGQEKELGVRFD